MDAIQLTNAEHVSPTVPAAIVAECARLRLRSQYLFTLERIAAGGRLAADGSVINSHGGSDLVEACRCSRSTFFARRRKLEAAGLLTTTKTGYRLAGRDVGNVYAIPARPAGPVPERQQLRFVPAAKAGRRPETGRPETGRGGARKPDPMVCNIKNGMDGNTMAPGNGRKRKNTLRADTTLETLRDPGSLLALYYDTLSRGLACTSEAGRLRFFAAAVAACNWREARDPLAVFAHNVNAGRVLAGDMLFITQADEDQAHAMIQSAVYGD